MLFALGVQIHGGILARRNEAHLAELNKHSIVPINVVVCNLYPFSEVHSLFFHFWTTDDVFSKSTNATRWIR
jgi:hypothetical protein